MSNSNSEFKSVMADARWSDALYRFLQVVFHLYPEDKFHHLISTTTQEKNSDEEIYKFVQAKLSTIKPFLSEITYSLPALKKQKKAMNGQLLKLLGVRNQINGYLEIGTTGRYISVLRKHIPVKGAIYLTNDIAPTNGVADIFERGQLKKIGNFIPLNDYKPVSQSQIPDENLEVVTCFIGLHHCPPDLLDGYIKSIHRILRKGGLFIMRDHDVKTPEMAVFVSLIHTVFNLGLNIPWETDSKEYKKFRPVDEWSKMLLSYGFEDSGERLLQDKDPSDNTLMAFEKV